MPKTADDHLPLRWLADHLDGCLAGPRAVRTREHLDDGCEACAERLEALSALLAALREGPLDHPPRRLVREALDLFDQVRGHLPSAVEGTRVGQLILDVRVGQAVALRSRLGDDRKLLWTIDEYEMDASLQARGEGFDLLGQVVPPGDDPAAAVEGHVVAYRDHDEVDRASIGPDGRFTFRGLTAGPYAFGGAVDGTPFLLPVVIVD